MPKSLALFIAAVFVAAPSGVSTFAHAKPKSITGSCPIKGGRSPCAWVEKCLLDGGTPERRPFSGKLVCKKPALPAPKAQQSLDVCQFRSALVVSMSQGDARKVNREAAAEEAGNLGERRFSGRLSDDYSLWRLARPFLGEVHAVFARELRSFTRDRSGPLNALDLGTGDGAIAKLLLAEAMLDVTGIDNEPKMLEQAQKNLLPSIESGRLTLILDDALQFLGYQPPQSFDIVASGYVLHNLTADYRMRLYGEIWRVLAPSGILINADKYAQIGDAHRAALRWQLGRFFDVLEARKRYDLLREWVLHYVEDEAADRVMQETVAIASLEGLGFADVNIVYRKHMDAVLVARKQA